MPQLEHEFTLILSGIDDLNDDLLDALYESGCDDALVGMREQVAFADFCREAPSFEEAVASAIRDVSNAGIRAELKTQIHGR